MTLNSAHVALATEFYTNAPNFNDMDELIRNVTAQSQLINLFKNLKYQIISPKIIVESLCHSSFVNEFKDLALVSNERLELLGDSVFNLYVTEELFGLYSHMSEGELSRMRGALVNESRLQEIARLIELPSVILTGKGEAKRNGFEGAAIMSDAFEALVGAIYLDSGKKRVWELLQHIFTIWKAQKGESFFDDKILLSFDAKSRLQELTMSLFKEHPIYKSTETKEGFDVSCAVNGSILANISGPSKKKAEKELAKIILQNNLLNKFSKEISDVN